MTSIDNKLKTLWESYSELKSAEKILAKQSRVIKDELDKFAKEFIESYERFPHKYALAVNKTACWGPEFNPLDKELSVDFSFNEIYHEYIKVEARWCFDPWEPGYSELIYGVPLDILNYKTPSDYFVFEYFKNGLHKKDEFGFMIGASTEEILENKIELYLGNSPEAKIAYPNLINWIIKMIEDEKDINDD